MPLFVGTSGYAYPAWKGRFYPAKLPAKQMLGYYAERFPAVEMNNTFYKLPTAASLTATAAGVPAGFRFAVKAPQQITHIRRLKDADAAVAELLESIPALGDRLGPLLFQLPPNLKKDADRLRTFLTLLPKTVRAAFEFRHPSWFDDEVFGLLRASGAALCLAEADDDLGVPAVATAGWGYLRLRRAEYDDQFLKAWAKRVREFGWSDTFVFFKHEDEANGPRFAARFRELVG